MVDSQLTSSNALVNRNETDYADCYAFDEDDDFFVESKAMFTIKQVVLTVSAMLDDTVRDEEYVLKAYDYPILGKVPDLLDNGNRSYAYYSQRRTTKKTQGKEG